MSASWAKGRCEQGQLGLQWAEGKASLAGYPTKRHTGLYQRRNFILRSAAGSELDDESADDESLEVVALPKGKKPIFVAVIVILS